MKSYLHEMPGSYEEKIKECYKLMAKTFCHQDSTGDFSSIRKAELHYDYTPAALKKRLSATLSYRTKATKELSGIENPKYLAETVAFSNCLILRGGYNNYDICMPVVLASAIWILDQLNLQGNLDALYPLLPDVNDEDIIPPVHHPQYDWELFGALAKLIYYRNEANYRPLEFSLTTLYASKGNGDPRSAYDAVMALLNKDAVETAQKNYEQKVWDFYRLAILGETKLKKKIDQLDEEIEILKKQNIQAGNVRVLSVVNYSSQENSVDEKISLLSDQRNTLVNLSLLTQVGLPDSREKFAKRHKNIIGKTLADQLVQFEMEDPYEAAFALLTLLDADDLLPWMFYGSICVAYTTVDQLPFYWKHLEIGNIKLLSEMNSVLYSHKFKGVRFKDAKDCNGESVERTYGKNLSQILFFNTFALYPRVAKEFTQIHQYFEELGVENEEVKQLYTLIACLLDAGDQKVESLQGYKLRQELETMIQSELNQEKKQKSTDEKTIENLHKKIETMRKLLYEENRLKQQAVQKQHQIQNENLRLIREIADLRSIIFTQQNTVHVSKTSEIELNFPIITSGKIVSFGGHPNWIKEMKSLLPKVQFYSSEIIPNKDVIRNADQVWVQTQYISHASFYRIESALGPNTQLRYFFDQNVRNCAEQIARSNVD